MSTQTNENISGFERVSNTITTYSGSSPVFITAAGLILLWGVTGPVFHFSNTWLLIVNTGTSIITFLMVFLIQKSQNKESLSIQLKLNELVAAHEFASNRLVNVESMSEEELKVIQKYYSRLSMTAKNEESLRQSHSIDEAEQMSDIKTQREEDIKEHLQDKNKK